MECQAAAGFGVAAFGCGLFAVLGYLARRHPSLPPEKEDWPTDRGQATLRILRPLRHVHAVGAAIFTIVTLVVVVSC